MIIDKISYDNIEFTNYDGFWSKAKTVSFDIDKNYLKNMLHEYYDIKTRVHVLKFDGKCDYINTTTLLSCVEEAIETSGLTDIQRERLELWMRGESGTAIAQQKGISNKVFYDSLDVACSKIAERLKTVIKKCY